MITHNPISKLQEIADFYGVTRSQALQALIEREHSALLEAAQASDRPWIYFENTFSIKNYLKKLWQQDSAP